MYWGRETEGQPEAQPQYVAADLLDASQMILAQREDAQRVVFAR